MDIHEADTEGILAADSRAAPEADIVADTAEGSLVVRVGHIACGLEEDGRAVHIAGALAENSREEDTDTGDREIAVEEDNTAEVDPEEDIAAEIDHVEDIAE
jgi:hypothetical protein